MCALIVDVTSVTKKCNVTIVNVTSATKKCNAAIVDVTSATKKFQSLLALMPQKSTFICFLEASI